MKISPIIGTVSVLALTLASPVRVQAQSDPDEDTTTTTEDTDPEEKTIGAGTPSNQLPPSQSDDDPQPKAASPQVPTGGVVRQAGVGGTTAYGRSGVLELGGSANWIGADQFTQISVNPSFGWFFMDNLQISAILGFSHLSTEGLDANFFTALLEPSIHIPFSDYLFGMVGAGAGFSYVEGPGVGFAVAPRVGLNILIGRSGVLTPQFFLQYATHEAIPTPNGSLLAVSTTYGAGLGYTVMW